MPGVNLCTYRRAREAYYRLPPKERVGMTAEKLAALVAPCPEGTI